MNVAKTLRYIIFLQYKSFYIFLLVCSKTYDGKMRIMRGENPMKKHNSIKRLSVYLTALILLVSMAGCGGSAGDQTGTANTPSESKASDGTASNTKLVFWNLGLKVVDDTGAIATEDLAIYQAIKKYEGETGGKVEIVNQSYDNWQNLFQSAGLAGNGPDLAQTVAGAITLGYKDFIEPLDKYFTADELAGFMNLDMLRTDYKADGELLGIPTDVTTLNLFYNKEIFKKAGLDPEKKLETFAELEDACAKIKAAGYQPMAINDADGSNSAWVVCEFLSDKLGNSQIFGFKDGTIKVTDDVFVQSFKGWTDFTKKAVENGWCREDSFSSNTDNTSPFYAGQAGMVLGGSWNCFNVYTSLGENAGTMPIPALSADDPYKDYICSQFGSNVVITNYSKNKEEAVRFLKILAQKDTSLNLYNESSTLPARLDVDLSASKAGNPLALECYNWITQNKNVVGFDSIMPAAGCAEWYRVAPLACAGKYTVEDAITAINQKNEEALAAK